MKKVKLLLLFLTINLGCLAVGAWLMNNGPRETWYLNLNRAPWTPPGWVFGAAWSFIMICFAVYLTDLFSKSTNLNAKIAYTLQIILNVSWNYVFFNQHMILAGLIILLLLNAVIYFFYFRLKPKSKKTKFLLLPYIIWLGIATSLNLYTLIYN